MVEKFITNHTLFIIPSWSDLVGNQIVGRFKNSEVKRILSDPVIFFGGTESTVQIGDETLHFIFGLGYYSVKAEFDKRIKIKDSREFSCLLLSDFVYDLIAYSELVALKDHPDIIINKYIAKIPINLNHKKNNEHLHIQEILTAQLFLPFKDEIIDMMDRIKESRNFDIDVMGQRILSTKSNFFNRILVSSIMDLSNSNHYFDRIPGIEEIIYGADQVLEKAFLPMEIYQINNKIAQLQRVYSGIEYDRNYLYTIISHASHKLEFDIPNVTNLKTIEALKDLKKKVILLSAIHQIQSNIPWNPKFPRRSKEELEEEVLNRFKQREIEKPTRIATITQSSFDEQKSNIENQPIPEINSQSSKIEVVKDKTLNIFIKPYVEQKEIPAPPVGNIEDILAYIKKIITEDYEIRAIGKALGRARSNIIKIIKYTPYMGELEKLAKSYEKQKPNIGLSEKDKHDLRIKVEQWINLQQRL